MPTKPSVVLQQFALIRSRLIDKSRTGRIHSKFSLCSDTEDLRNLQEYGNKKSMEIVNELGALVSCG